MNEGALGSPFFMPMENRSDAIPVGASLLAKAVCLNR